MTTIVNIRNQPYDIYCGRAGKGQSGYYGNPHVIGYCAICNVTHDRAGCIAAHKEDFLRRIAAEPLFRQNIERLRDKRLGCFCAPLQCHCENYVDWLNNNPPQK